MTTLTGTQLGFQSTQNIADLPVNAPIVHHTSGGTTFTNTTTVTTSTVVPTGSASVTDGTTADPAATYVGSNGGTPMFAIKNPNGVTPPNFGNSLAGSPILGSTPQGFNDQGTINQGLIGKL